MSATSFYRGQRVRRPATMPQFTRWVQDGCASLAPDFDSNTATHEERLTERLITAMRTAQGLSLATLDTYPLALVAKLMRNAKPYLDSTLGRTPALAITPTHLTPVLPRGYMISNTIISDLMNV